MSAIVILIPFSGFTTDSCCCESNIDWGDCLQANKISLVLKDEVTGQPIMLDGASTVAFGIDDPSDPNNPYLSLKPYGLTNATNSSFTTLLDKPIPKDKINEVLGSFLVHSTRLCAGYCTPAPGQPTKCVVYTVTGIDGEPYIALDCTLVINLSVKRNCSDCILCPQ